MLAIKPASIYNGAVKDSGLWKKPIDAFSVMGLLLSKTVCGSRVMNRLKFKLKYQRYINGPRWKKKRAPLPG